MAKSFSETIHQVLREKGNPSSIRKLMEVGLTLRPVNHPERYEAELYSLAKSQESHFVVEGYPSFKLASSTKFPTLEKRGYRSAAFKVLMSSKRYLDVREIVQRAMKEDLLRGIQSHIPEYYMYVMLRDDRKVFSQKGDLLIGLKEPQAPTSVQKQKPDSLTIEPSQPQTRRMEVTQNIYEANLESILTDNLDRLEQGLRLIQRQYVCPGIGRIDLLCEDKEGNLVVIELKKFGARHDSVIDQVARYMGYVKTHLAKPHQNVRGMIVVARVDDRLRYAVAAFPNIEVKRFNVTIE